MIVPADFTYLNKKHFGGNLPYPLLHTYTTGKQLSALVPDPDGHECNTLGSFWCDCCGIPHIAISTAQKHDDQCRVLLHEMIHEAIWQSYDDLDELHNLLDLCQQTWDCLAAFIANMPTFYRRLTQSP